MKKFFVMAIIALVSFTACEKMPMLSDADEADSRMQMKSASVDGKWTVTRNAIEDGMWKVDFVHIENGEEVEKDSIRINLNSTVKVYDMTTTITDEASLKSLAFGFDGDLQEGEYNEKGIKTDSQSYVHTFDKVDNLVVVHTFENAKAEKHGINVFTPNRNARISYTGEPKITEDGSDSEYSYYKAAMDYTVSIDGKESTVTGYHRLAIANEQPEDVLVDVKVLDKGFEELTYDGNGNLKTGKSWMDMVRIYSVSGEKPFREEAILNYFAKGADYAIEYGSSFNGINEIGTGAGSVNDGSTRMVGSYITVTEKTQNYNSGLIFDGKSYSKDFTTGWETAVWSDGEHTFEMPSPTFKSMNINWNEPEGLPTSEGYERMLQTINLNGSINGKNLKKVKAETELRVKEEEETFTVAVIDSAFVYVNPTTSDTKITIRETGSKGTVREYERDVNVYNGIEAPASVTKDVDEFDNRSNEARLNKDDEYVGSRESGEFTIYRYKMGFTVGSENVDRYFRPYYERAYHNPTKTWMMWKKYENVTDNGFNTTDLTNQTSGSDTYLRKKYVYAMSATYNGHGDNANAEAILRVKVVPEEERETPSWLGAPQWAEYTRVQKAEGSQFEDMIVFGYENGVVLAPKGQVNLTSGIFAYDQAVANAHGVQKCAKGSCYTGVYKNNAWIPAKCETTNGGKSNETWIYTGYGVSHSVMANNAISLGIGTNVTWNPGEEVTINNGTITVKYSKNNTSLNGNDLISLK